uniref:Polynucleotide adenylyltransferase n=1 Tax=Mucochytrium quahogii TaxID=96639 RepID=A0A7S2SPJ0_9STRA|mmetsp:Transcript_13861/g.22625  ORF Transcript_13861/g.22625 Transcript_13861/m.22625 type:complete len:625 (+) Transcript_13861:20-1894(+)
MEGRKRSRDISSRLGGTFSVDPCGNKKQRVVVDAADVVEFKHFGKKKVGESNASYYKRVLVHTDKLVERAEELASAPNAKKKRKARLADLLEIRAKVSALVGGGEEEDKQVDYVYFKNVGEKGKLESAENYYNRVLDTLDGRIKSYEDKFEENSFGTKNKRRLAAKRMVELVKLRISVRDLLGQNEVQVVEKEPVVKEPVVEEEEEEAFSLSDGDDDEEEVERKEPLKQPVFVPNSLAYADFEPDAQTSVVGKGIRDLLNKRDKTPSKQPKDSDQGFISVVEFDPRQVASSSVVKASGSSTSVPWLSGVSDEVRTRSTLLLHNEILRFCKFIGETAREKESRNEDVAKVKGLVSELYPDATVKVFGSMANDLCIPSSDIDMVLLDVPTNAIRRLSNNLRKREMVEHMEVIPFAKVPIIKLRLKGSAYTMDICFNEKGGPESGRMIRRLISQMPALRPITLVVKFFLDQRGLNEPYRGGVGSHLCLSLVVSMLQQVRKRLCVTKLNPGDRVEDLEDLGTLLLEFFELYGKRMNYDKVAISLRSGGSYFEKPNRWKNSNKIGLICCENPEEPDNDLGGSAFQYARVRRAFGHAYRVLRRKLEENNNTNAESILGSIIHIDETLEQR